MQNRSSQKTVFLVFQVFRNHRRPVAAWRPAMEHLVAQVGVRGVPSTGSVPPWATPEWSISGQREVAPTADQLAGPQPCSALMARPV